MYFFQITSSNRTHAKDNRRCTNIYLFIPVVLMFLPPLVQNNVWHLAFRAWMFANSTAELFELSYKTASVHSRFV
jgi:hypothetical protein